MQIHADVSGRPIAIPEEQQAVTLGSAIAATVAAGMHPDITTAASAMVRVRHGCQSPIPLPMLLSPVRGAVPGNL